MEPFEKCDERRGFRRAQIVPVRRHVATALDHLADELILSEPHRNAVECRTTLPASLRKGLTVAALFDLKDKCTLSLQRGRALEEVGRHGSGAPVPVQFVHGTTALERQGALVFQVKQCRNCHSLGASGGQRGPALDSDALRLTHDQLIRQVIQGGGNMPAYGNNLSPAETTALVAFLETLHPAGQAPARDASREFVLAHP
jgi:cytochrome c5